VTSWDSIDTSEGMAQSWLPSERILGDYSGAYYRRVEDALLRAWSRSPTRGN